MERLCMAAFVFGVIGVRVFDGFRCICCDMRARARAFKYAWSLPSCPMSPAVMGDPEYGMGE